MLTLVVLATYKPRKEIKFPTRSYPDRLIRRYKFHAERTALSSSHICLSQRVTPAYVSLLTT